MQTCSGGEWLDRQNSAEVLELEIGAAMGRLVSVTQFVRALVSGGHLPSRDNRWSTESHTPSQNTTAAETSHSSHGALGFFLTALTANAPIVVCVPLPFIFLHYLWRPVNHQGGESAEDEKQPRLA